MAATVLSLCACTANGGTENETTDAETTAPDTTEAETTAAEEITLTVKVVDSDGAAVSGVTIQVCDDSNCFLSTSDENGNAVFKSAQIPSVTSSHKLSVPFLSAGYEYTGESEIYLEDGITEYTVTVTKTN